MDFDFSEEQRLLRDSVERLLADHYAFDKRRSYLAEPDGWSRALWSQYAELGLLGLPFAEEHGGRQARYDLSDVLTRARPKTGGWVLDGAKSVVAHGDSADKLVVSARTA